MKESISVKCPQCDHAFSLSEGVLSGLRENISRELQSDIQSRERALSEHRKTLELERQQMKRQQEELQEQVQKLVDKQLSEREAEIRLKAEERAKQKAEEAGALELKALKEDLESKQEALKKSQEAELELRRQKRLLAEEKEALALETQRKLDAEREKLREAFQKQADEENRLKIAEKEKVITDLQTQLKEAQRKAEQGSMQTQGDVLEVDLEQQLRQAFPLDRIEPVSTGVRGADIVQEVVSRTGRSCGTILYETKRTKNWSNEWPTKLKADMREARATLAILVTQALPKEIERFGELEGVWVTDYASTIPLAIALRHSLHEVMLARGHQEGAKEKMQLLYDYLTGNDFRQRVQSVIETFASLRADLEKEKRAMQRIWKKRETQLEIVIDNMSGMFGDVQALSGGAIEDIGELELDEDETA